MKIPLQIALAPLNPQGSCTYCGLVRGRLIENLEEEWLKRTYSGSFLACRKCLCKLVEIGPGVLSGGEASWSMQDAEHPERQ